MENRYKIPAGIQNRYLIKIENKSGLRGNQLANLFNISGRSYRDWKRGRYAMTKRAVEIISKRFNIDFPYSKISAFNEWRKIKINAAKQGALARMELYGAPGTPEGRKKGGTISMQILRKRGLIPTPKPFVEPVNYSIELAEFVGILLGDGHIGKEQWTITLNSVKDKKYSEFVSKRVNDLFKFQPSEYLRINEHVIVISGSGIRSIKYFIKIGLIIGNKVQHQVGVPLWITQNKQYSQACLRGLIDTDGGIFKHSYVVHGKQYTYTKLCFTNRSLPLLQFVYKTLKTIRLNPKIIDNVENKKVWLYNQTEVKQYIQSIGTNNPRLLTNMGG